MCRQPIADDLQRGAGRSIHQYKCLLKERPRRPARAPAGEVDVAAGASTRTAAHWDLHSIWQGGEFRSCQRDRIRETSLMALPRPRRFDRLGGCE